MTTTPLQPFTLERMRADVARVIGEAAEEIGLDDNLMDWGLDSMRLLHLVIHWQQGGLALDVSELAQHMSLNDWWRLVNQHQRQD